MGLDDKDVPKTAKLCSLHFEESAFDRKDDYYIRIRPGVIPSVYKIIIIIKVDQSGPKSYRIGP